MRQEAREEDKRFCCRQTSHCAVPLDVTRQTGASEPLLMRRRNEPGDSITILDDARDGWADVIIKDTARPPRNGAAQYSPFYTTKTVVGAGSSQRRADVRDHGGDQVTSAPTRSEFLSQFPWERLMVNRTYRPSVDVTETRRCFRHSAQCRLWVTMAQACGRGARPRRNNRLMSVVTISGCGHERGDCCMPS
jgi:hypothetical protein